MNVIEALEARGRAKPPDTDAAQLAKVRAMLVGIWGPQLWVGWAVAVAAVVLFAKVAGDVIPRGPVTATQALVSMTVAVGVGLAAGFATGSRWTMLVGPVLFTVVFELKRLSLVGPTVDLVDLGSFYGAIAFILASMFRRM